MTRSVLGGCISLKSTRKATGPETLLKIHEKDETSAEHYNWNIYHSEIYFDLLFRESVNTVGL